MDKTGALLIIAFLLAITAIAYMVEVSSHGEMKTEKVACYDRYGYVIQGVSCIDEEHIYTINELLIGASLAVGSIIFSILAFINIEKENK